MIVEEIPGTEEEMVTGTGAGAHKRRLIFGGTDNWAGLAKARVQRRRDAGLNQRKKRRRIVRYKRAAHYLASRIPILAANPKADHVADWTAIDVISARSDDKGVRVLAENGALHWLARAFCDGGRARVTLSESRVYS